MLPPKAEFQLETRHKNRQLQIRVDGKWRHNRHWYTHCDGRACGYDGPELEFFGCKDSQGTLFWGVCPACGWETITYYVGWRAPTGQRAGGTCPGWLRGRRANSGY